MALEMTTHTPISYDGRGWSASHASLPTPVDSTYSDHEFSSSPVSRMQMHLAQLHIERTPSERKQFNMFTPSTNNMSALRVDSPQSSFHQPRGPVQSAEFSPRISRHNSGPTSRAFVTPTRSPPPMLSPMKASTQYMVARPVNDRLTHFRGVISDDSLNDSMRSYDNVPSMRHTRCSLPSCALDDSGTIAVTFQEIIEGDIFEKFVKDKTGCHYLQENYPERDSALRSKLFEIIDSKEYFFEEMAKDVFANFFVQKMLENSTPAEQDWITSKIHNNMFSLCLNRYSCRVIQKAIEILPDEHKAMLVKELQRADLVMLTVDQNANHVVQKILNSFDLPHWAFIIAYLTHEDNFFDVVENKYGCRVIQLAIEILSEGHHVTVIANARHERITVGQLAALGTDVSRIPREILLEEMMDRLLVHCERLSSNEFANYVIQHVIKTPCLAEYREKIIDKCLLGKLLSLCQEKYASHVVEKAMEHASANLLRDMMDEIFDGYVPHPETKKDALDILLFHQFGNYVVQRMLQLCINPASRLNSLHRNHWFRRLEDRIERHKHKLQKYSSGKKIIEMLNATHGKPSAHSYH